MSQADYFDRIDQTFEAVESRLEELAEDPDIATAEGVINVTFANGVVFVFSRQPPVEQLWLATPGGGFHFIWDAALDDWQDTKTGESFGHILVTELRQHTGVNIDWE